MNKEDAIKKFETESGYRSPIELIYSDLQMKIEDSVCEAVQSVGVNVDKDELVKALQYDRDQYAKGFADGYAQGIEVGKNIVIEELKRCIESGFKRSVDVKFMAEEKKCENCANCSPWDGYCGLGNNEAARDRGVCERWESK